MTSQVKEFFNSLEIEKKREEKARKRRRYYKGMKPTQNYNAADITDFTHFMECDISPDICPMIWEELEIDFNNKDRRYCNICDKHVYKANNKFMINKLLHEKQCFSIPISLLEEINGTIDEERYKNLEDRLIISKLFLFYKKYYEWEWDVLESKGLNYESQLKYMLRDIISDDYKIKDLLNKNVDLEYIIKLVLGYGKDEDFEKMVLDRIKQI